MWAVSRVCYCCVARFLSTQRSTHTARCTHAQIADRSAPRSVSEVDAVTQLTRTTLSVCVRSCCRLIPCTVASPPAGGRLAARCEHGCEQVQAGCGLGAHSDARSAKSPVGSPTRLLPDYCLASASRCSPRISRISSSPRIPDPLLGQKLLPMLSARTRFQHQSRHSNPERQQPTRHHASTRAAMRAAHLLLWKDMYHHS